MIDQANKNKTQELQAARDSFNAKLAAQAATAIEAEEKSQDLEKRLESARARAQEAEKALESAEERCRELEKRVRAADKDAQTVSPTPPQHMLDLLLMRFVPAQVDALVKAKEAEKKATQTELEDLLMVFGDLEEKATRYKVGCYPVLARLRPTC